MMEPKYQLIPAQSTSARHRWPTLLSQAGLVITAALLLIVGVLYAPLLWEQPPVAAEPENAAAATSGTGAPAPQMTASLMDDQEALADLYEAVAPSVVNIQVASRSDFTLPGFDIPDDESPLQESQGSGFIYDDQGHIITNNHVVEGAETVLVVFNNGFWAAAEVVASDPQADLAVIRVEPPANFEWRPLPLAAAEALRVGHSVIAIGNPFGLDGTMTTGVVSALGRGVPVGDGAVSRYTLPDVIQTDAAINPGNSGGPLLNLNGEVVGINFAIRSQVRANAGVGFAIPVSIIGRIVPALIEDGRYPYAYLGMQGSSISAPLAALLGLAPNELGVYVAEVIPGSPSADAGLQGGSEVVTDENGIEFERGGDIVTAIDGQRVQRFEDLVSYLVTQAAPGQTITLTIVRNDETLQVPVVLGERPATTASAASPAPGLDGINAREAIELATQVAEESGVLTSEIMERIATPDELEGGDVWVVELVTETETVMVTLDALTGEVLSLDVE